MPTPHGCFHGPHKDPLDPWNLLKLLLPWPWRQLL
jgi:hypothetical protein